MPSRGDDSSAHDSILILGGTRILSPAVHSLCEEGHDAAVVGRDPSTLAQLASDVSNLAGTGTVTPVVADFLAPDALQDALRGVEDRHVTFTDCIAYCPDAPPATYDVLGAFVRSRLLLILTSRYADPSRGLSRDMYPRPRGEAGPRVLYLLLGWDATGPITRWHTPTEISMAALACLREDRDGQLGVVRPWSRRPA